MVNTRIPTNKAKAKLWITSPPRKNSASTTLLAVLALFFYGGEIMHGFSVALTVGILVGTYSSIYIASPVTLALGITREDMLPPKKEGATDSHP